MAELILPIEFEAPWMLTPGRKPVGKVKLNPGHGFYAPTAYALPFQNAVTTDLDGAKHPVTDGHMDRGGLFFTDTGSQKVDVDSKSGLDPNNCTIIASYYITSPSGVWDTMIFEWGAGGSEGMKFERHGWDPYVIFTHTDDWTSVSVSSTSGDTPIPSTKFHTAVIQIVGAEIRLWTDGVYHGSSTIPADSLSGLATLKVGEELQGGVNLLAYSPKVVAKSLARSLSKNPYQLLIPV